MLAWFARYTKRLIITFAVVFVMLIVVRQFVEARYVPSLSMEPTLEIGDRFLVEKVSRMTGRQIERGDILVFYSPPSIMGGELQNEKWPRYFGPASLGAKC